MAEMEMVTVCGSELMMDRLFRILTFSERPKGIEILGVLNIAFIHQNWCRGNSEVRSFGNLEPVREDQIIHGHAVEGNCNIQDVSEAFCSGFGLTYGGLVD